MSMWRVTQPFLRRMMGSERRLSYVDPNERKFLIDSAAGISPSDAFIAQVADPASQRDAAIYRNNVERYVGTVKVPVGLIGPLSVSFQGEPLRNFLVPMATTEGALLASYQRGCKALTLGGGATASVVGQQMIRAPVIVFERALDASNFVNWFHTNNVQVDAIQAISTEPHCAAVDVHVTQTDRCVHIHIGINSDDAAGQNMVTYCGRKVMTLVRERYTATPFETFIEGGMNSGKRGSVLHLMRGKGFYTIVDAMVPDHVCRDLLHASPAEIASFQRMHQRGSLFLGTLSFT